MKMIKSFKAGPTLMIIIVTLSLVIGWGIRAMSQPKDLVESAASEQHEPGYKHISPLLGCADLHDPNKNFIENELNKRINENIKQKDITYASLYFRDLNNGPWIGINEGEKFTPASLLKVPLMIAYLKWAESDKSILDREIPVTDSNNILPQNIIPLRTIEPGKTYKVSDLIEYMIIYSDNLAANTLLEHIDGKILTAVYSDLGLTEPSAANSENFMSVRDYASFFRILYNASYLNHEMSEMALTILTKSQYSLGLSAGVPSQVEVAHKFGERVLADGKQLHDCGIIYKENSPYLLCIMTRGHDFERMSSTIKELSDLTYRNFK